MFLNHESSVESGARLWQDHAHVKNSPSANEKHGPPPASGNLARMKAMAPMKLRGLMASR
jgi:hypothetical protein